MPCILHISGDYPDAYQTSKSPVIQRLVEALSESSRNVVISLNRVSHPGQVAMQMHEDVFSLRYFSPPLGLLQSHYLDRLANQVITLLESAAICPTVVIGHKFTIESHVAWRVAQHFNIRYVAAFMGNSDRKIFRLKPHYHHRYRQIVANASAVIFPTPWCRDYFKKRLFSKPPENNSNKIYVIPYISVDQVSPVICTPVKARHVVVICRLDVWKIKNLHRLIAAISELEREEGAWQLDIVGAGTDDAKFAVQKLITRYTASHCVSMLGGMNRAQIDAVLPRYSAMVMPSYPESFGLVYLEAIAQGVPIMTARNSGFDGFFPEEFPGVVVAHDSVSAIKTGLKKLAENAVHYREIIAQLGPELQIFSRSEIVSQYRSALRI